MGNLRVLQSKTSLQRYASFNRLLRLLRQNDDFLDQLYSFYWKSLAISN